MEFLCTLEGPSGKTISLAKVVLEFYNAGYTIKAQKREEASDGSTYFHIHAESKQTKSAPALERELSGIHACKLSRLEVGGKVYTYSASSSAEDTLKQLGQHYPNISKLVKGFAATLDESSRSAELAAMGARVGAGIYNRDYSLGSPLAMPAAMNRELVPALKEFSSVDASESTVTLVNCPFCAQGSAEVSACEFVTGFIQGFLDKNPATPGFQAREASCGSGKGNRCTYTLDG